MILSILDYVGTFAFALSGAFRAVKYELDLLGVFVLATATGVGGGIARDVLLGATPPTALKDGSYLAICILAGVAVFVAARRIAHLWDMVLFADAVGLGVFAAIGAAKAESLGATPFTVVLMASLTASGGGVVRDLLVREIPAALTTDVYATAALAGGGVWVLTGYLGFPYDMRILLTVLLTWIVRMLALRYGLSLPRVSRMTKSPSQIVKAKRRLARREAASRD
ncbi:MAG: hypothetical protein RL318_2114 [Fibrobacterota bacterium]